MICPECGFKNTTGANFCGKCNKSLKTIKHKCLGHAKTQGFCGNETSFRKHRKFVEFSSELRNISKKHSSAFEFKNKTSIMLKALILIFTVIGISGVASAHHVTGNSLPDGAVQKGTVYIEDGFSGIVTIKDPLLHKKANIKVNYQTFSSGSGSIVSKNGYIITAFHVIGDPNTLENTNKLKKMDNKDIKRYIDEIALMKYLKNKDPQLGYKLSKNQNFEKNMGHITNNFIKKGWISAKSYKLSVYVKGLGLNGVNSKNSLKAHLIDVGNSKRDEDIALLKVNPPKGKNLPVLKISSKNPKIGEKVSIYGYPGNKMEARQKHSKTKHSAVQSSDYTPFVSSGRLTAKSPNPRGIMYYKTNAITAEGYSGGPVVNSKNRVTGVLVFGVYSKDKMSGKVKTTASLFLSPKYIKEICKKNKVPITVA